MSKWFLPYSFSIALTLLSVLLGASSTFSGNGKLFDGYQGLVLAGGSIVSLGIFLFMSRVLSSSFIFRVLNGCFAAFVIPVALVLLPTLYCIFVSHGECS